MLGLRRADLSPAHPFPARSGAGVRMGHDADRIAAAPADHYAAVVEALNSRH